MLLEQGSSKSAYLLSAAFGQTLMLKKMREGAIDITLTSCFTGGYSFLAHYSPTTLDSGLLLAQQMFPALP